MDKSKITIELIAPECDKDVVFCSGVHDDWITSSRVVELKRVSRGLYRGTAKWAGKMNRYKYHLGDWHGVELNEWGAPASDRFYSGEGNVRDYVPQFTEDYLYHNSKYLPQIERLPTNLPLPKPFATRRIAALLPANYESSKKSFPVLYLQDGQNLFDEFAPYGNWELDKRLAWMAERGLGDFIVVAIDHAEEKRVKEYATPTALRVEQGHSDAYARFLVNHLKPLIDSNYRTLPDRANTAIGGSSMGALASLDAAMSQAQHFGNVMLLSPSIWVDPKLATHWEEHNYGPTRVFLYGGLQESPGSAATFAELAKVMRSQSSARRPIYVNTHFDGDGQHNESAWGQVFPRAASFLFS